MMRDLLSLVSYEHHIPPNCAVVNIPRGIGDVPNIEFVIFTRQVWFSTMILDINDFPSTTLLTWLNCRAVDVSNKLNVW